MSLRAPSRGAVRLICSLVALLTLGVYDSSSQTPPPPPIYFEQFLTKRFSKPTDKEPWTVERLCPVSSSVVARRVFSEYGAMFSASDSVIVPDACIYPGEADVVRYQSTMTTEVLEFGNVRIELQRAAGEKLRAALTEAQTLGLRITPLDGAIAGRRSFGQTLMLWNSRFIPGLEFWIKRGRLAESDRNDITALELPQKIEKVLEWESRGIYFSTSRTRSILTSTAPPGASQHLGLIAFDVVEYGDAEIQAILNRNGWYQTIVDDPPHFTYLGVPEIELPSRGLRSVQKGGYKYWLPNLTPPPALPTTH